MCDIPRLLGTLVGHHSLRIVATNVPCTVPVRILCPRISRKCQHFCTFRPFQTFNFHSSLYPTTPCILFIPISNTSSPQSLPFLTLNGPYPLPTYVKLRYQFFRAKGSLQSYLSFTELIITLIYRYCIRPCTIDARKKSLETSNTSCTGEMLVSFNQRVIKPFWFSRLLPRTNLRANLIAIQCRIMKRSLILKIWWKYPSAVVIHKSLTFFCRVGG